MCENTLIVSEDFVPLSVESSPHSFKYYSAAAQRTFIEKFDFGGNFNFSSVQKIENSHGVKEGYMFIIGEKEDQYQDLENI